MAGFLSSLKSYGIHLWDSAYVCCIKITEKAQNKMYVHFNINVEISSLTLCAATSTLSRNRSHSKMKCGFLSSGSCCRAASFRVNECDTSIIVELKQRI